MGGAAAKSRMLWAVSVAACVLIVVFAGSAHASTPFAPQRLDLSPALLESRRAAASSLPPPGGFELKGSNGYSLFVLGVPAHKGQPASVAIFVTGRRGGAYYAAPASVSETSIQADLGGLGKINVTFHPSGQARKARPVCGGKPYSFDSGTYDGTIAFHGEEGYTSAEATSVQGSLGFIANILCGSIVGESRGSFLPGARLKAYAGASSRAPHVEVIKNRPTGWARYGASVSEVHEGISISRFIGAVEPAPTFVFDPAIQTATLRPSAPFSGVAQFHRDAKPANRWSGNLTVDLPGRSDVKLTGKGDRASLARAQRDWRTGASS